MKGQPIRRGLIRGLNKFRKLANLPEIEPEITSANRKRKHKPRRRIGPPPCNPGTNTYRDRLVRHLGYDSKRADAMLKAWRDHGAELPEL